MKEYSMTLKMGKDIYQGVGSTPEEAVASFPVPSKILTKATVTFAHGKEAKEVFLAPYQIKRLGMKISRMFLIKQFHFGLK